MKITKKQAKIEHKKTAETQAANNCKKYKVKIGVRID